MTIDSLGEFGLIENIKSKFKTPGHITGIGDDCAIIPQRNNLQTLVSTDMLIEGSHFLLDDITPEQLGWKSAAVNLSDIAAMGGAPTGTFLSIALPKHISQEWVNRFINGYKAISDEFDCALLGGDTTASPDRLCINVTVLGTAPDGSARKRSDAKPGDIICVSGTLGDSAAGLKLILDQLDRAPATAQTLIDRHYQPLPRIREGLRLSTIKGVHAMMDISDGIGSDLRHLLNASDVGAIINTNTLPFSEALLQEAAKYGWDPKDLALNGGEDYELLFTADPSADLSGIKHYTIGQITKEKALVWNGSDKDFMGFRHF